MPLYEYRCHQCQAEFELLVRDSEKPECPQCESAKLERRLSVVAAPSCSSGMVRESMAPQGNCGRSQCGMYGCQGLD